MSTIDKVIFNALLSNHPVPSYNVAIHTKYPLAFMNQQDTTTH